MKVSVFNGIDNLSSVKDQLTGKRLGLITNQSGVDKNLRPTSDILYQNFKLCALYSPEHGIRGTYHAGNFDKNHIDPETKLPVYVLSDKNSPPGEDMLRKIDVMLYDIQDVGARFYTYLYTLTRTMQSCAKYGKPLYVLDRPNPLSLSRTEGNILDEKFASFVGEYAIPTRYAMTVGEFARYINLTRKYHCTLTVVPCENLARNLYFDDTDLIFIPPSPNIPSFQTALSYVGTCLFEGTNLSEGRGTANPFELIGAPWLKSKGICERMKQYAFEGVAFRRAFFTPAFSKYTNELCEGIHIHVTEKRYYQPFEVALRLLDEIRNEFPQFQFSPGIDQLFGSDKLRTEYLNRILIDNFLTDHQECLNKFKESVRSYYLY